MLSSVLNSETAIEVNIQIIRIFTRIREVFLTQKDVLLKMEQLEKTMLKNNSVLHIRLDKPIEEMQPDAVTMLFSMEKPIVLRDMLNRIRRAKDENNIHGIFLDVGMVSVSYATLEEIRNALLDFKNSGKFIYAYADVLDNRGYYITSVADSIYLNPTGISAFLLPHEYLLP
jgi:protease IV